MTDTFDLESVIAHTNQEMQQLLEDIVTLCEMGEFRPEILLDFIGQGKHRNFIQFHRDYTQKEAAERGKPN